MERKELLKNWRSQLQGEKLLFLLRPQKKLYVSDERIGDEKLCQNGEGARRFIVSTVASANSMCAEHEAVCELLVKIGKREMIK